MRLHLFYEFKGRIILFSGLIVSIIRNISRVMNLDIEIRTMIFQANQLRQQLDKLRQQARPILQDAIKKNEKESLELQRKIENLKKNFEIINSRIKERVIRILKDINEELEDIRKISLEDETLLYKKSLHLRNLMHVLIKSKRMTFSQKRWILDELKNKAKILEGRVHHLDLEAKNIRRLGGSLGVTTLLLAEVSVRSDQRIMNIIKRKAIEIRALEDRINKLPKEDYRNIFLYFHQQVLDIYQLGTYKNLLFRRLKGIFNSTKMNFQNLNIKGLQSEFFKSEKHFKKTFEHIERLARRLLLEIRSKNRKLERLDEKEKKGLEELAKKRHQENIKTYESSKILNNVRQFTAKMPINRVNQGHQINEKAA